MNVRLPALGTALVLTAAAFADVDWMILPKYSGSGRMLVHGTRDSLPKKGKPPIRFAAKFVLEKPKGGKPAGYKYLRIGSMCGVNEKGLACIWTGGDPTSDKDPVGRGVLRPHAAAFALLGSCAKAEQAVARLKAVFDRKLVSGSAIFFVADPNRAFVIECSPGHFASWELPHALCVYSNCWKLPGMQDGSLNTPDRAAFNYQREWIVREALRMALDAKGTISVADSIRASRISPEDANGEAFAKRRGWVRPDTAPYNRYSADSYLFELDSEFPGELSCVYAAVGPQRHTVYLPIPLGAADALPKEISDKEWSERAYRLRDAAKTADPVRPELLEFEQKQLADYAKAREEARRMMRYDEFAGARKLLRSTLTRQAKETAEFLSQLK